MIYLANGNGHRLRLHLPQLLSLAGRRHHARAIVSQKAQRRLLLRGLLLLKLLRRLPLRRPPIQPETWIVMRQSWMKMTRMVCRCGQSSPSVLLRRLGLWKNWIIGPHRALLMQYTTKKELPRWAMTSEMHKSRGLTSHYVSRYMGIW